MEQQTLIEQIRDYQGDSPYLLTLQDLLLKGETLSEAQLYLAKNFIVKHAIKTNNKALLPKDVLRDIEIDWNRYNAKLPYPFQKQGINWLLNKPRAILGDDMGLGKSLQAAIAALETSAKKILVVCPATLKLNWANEILPFEKNVTVIEKGWVVGRFTIINYDKLHTFYDKIVKEKFDVLIADEAHYVKNMKSRRSKYLAKVANKIKRVWLLTGTPIANRPIDFYNLLKICKHEIGQRKDYFAQRYCGGTLTPWGYDTSGASNLRELHFKVQDVIFRRTAEEVLDLPELVRIPIFLELSSKKNYEKAVEDYFRNKYELSLDEDSEYYNSDPELGRHLVELSVLRRYTALEKVRDGSTMELINNVLTEGKKVVVFTNYLEVIDNLKEQLKDEGVVTVDGRLSTKERQTNIDKFQNDPKIKVIICNIKIASVGITLTAAQVGVVNDLDWSPANIMQSEKRLHRIGQKNNVRILYPIYKDSIDSIMYDLISNKIKNINQAVEGKKTASFNITQEAYARVFKK